MRCGHRAVIRAVFDTNVFLRALINPHSRCGRLLEEFADDYELVLSPAIIREVLEVLHRPRLRAKFPRIAQLDMARIIALFEQAPVVEPMDVPSISRDPNDDEFLACARSARAGYLVTEDRDLLVLEEYEGTRICQPTEFIALLEAGRAQGVTHAH
jgi:putative PIN family toxin of toxin-antitoxin system